MSLLLRMLSVVAGIALVMTFVLEPGQVLGLGLRVQVEPTDESQPTDTMSQEVQPAQQTKRVSDLGVHDGPTVEYTPITYTPKFYKLYVAPDGVAAPEETFTFILADMTDEAYKSGESIPEGGTTAQITIGASAEANAVTFGEITYTIPGTYYYTITENEPAQKTEGMTYDTTSKWVKVEVAPADNTTNLVATAAYGAKRDACTDKSLTITNTYGKTTVSISVVDAKSGAMLFGATIQILDANGKVVEEWTTLYPTHKVQGLNPGTSYTLHEVAAPSGYAIAPDTTFTLKDDGTIDTDKSKTTATVKDGTILIEHVMFVPGQANVSVAKIINTNTDWTTNEEFEFAIAKVDANTTDTISFSNIKVKAGETGDFKISYTEPGTYYYTIREIEPEAAKAKNGYLYYDTDAKYAKAVVTFNAKTGTLDVVVTYGASMYACTEKNLTITNIYAAPALEKYINKDVHSDLPAFDTPFTYDILAYVTKDAKRVVIHDSLRRMDGLLFNGTAKVSCSPTWLPRTTISPTARWRLWPQPPAIRSSMRAR